MNQMRGRASLEFAHPPLILQAASLAGKKEGQGPLGSLIDKIQWDDLFGADSWEKAESAMQSQTASLAAEKAGIPMEEIRYLFAGDLLGQLIATSFGLADLAVPLFGLYGACSTMGEAMGLGAMTVAAGYAHQILALASSHFATAEKQFRFPLGYGNQRPFSATRTVTGCGAVILTDQAKNPLARIRGITVGKIVDLGVRDSMNMGAAMAPAAFHTIWQNLEDFQTEPGWYDQIITGDLGEVGRKILLDLLFKKGISIESMYMDCGMEIYSKETQDTHAGGSGCGCSALVLCSLVLPRISRGIWKRVLFVPTGALLSTVSFNEGQSIPGIAHGVVIEAAE